MTLTSGTIIDGRYEILSSIGEGGMGDVYSAREFGVNRLIALKLLHSELIADKDAHRRFNLEAKLISKLHHKNLITCYRLGAPGKDVPPYIAMELLQGKSLRTLLNDEDSLHWRRAASIAVQVADAIEYAHSCGVLHRDLKPNNIFLLNEPEPDFVKVLDFGLAKVIEQQSQTNTQSGALLGSVAYMSPEQCQAKKVDPRTDIYSLGCILYEMLSGKPPFEADTPIGLLHRHVNDDPAELGDEIPKSLGRIVSMAMAKSTADRYQTMKDLKEDLQSVIAGATHTIDITRAHKFNPKVQTRPEKRRLAPLLLSASVILSIGVFAIDPFTGMASGLIVRLAGADDGSNLGMRIAEQLARAGYLRSAESTLNACADVNTNRFDRISILARQSKVQSRLGLSVQAERARQDCIKNFDEIGGRDKVVSRSEMNALCEVLALLDKRSCNSITQLSGWGYRYIGNGNWQCARTVIEKMLAWGSPLDSVMQAYADIAVGFLCAAVIEKDKVPDSDWYVSAALEANKKYAGALVRLDKPHRSHLLRAIYAAQKAAKCNARKSLQQLIAENQNMPAELIEMLMALAEEELRLDPRNHKAAAYYRQKAVDQCEAHPELWKQEITVLSALGASHYALDNKTQALKDFIKAEQLGIFHKDISKLWDVYNQIVRIEVELDQLASAREHSSKWKLVKTDSWQQDHVYDYVQFLIAQKSGDLAVTVRQLDYMLDTYKDKWDHKTKAGMLECLVGTLTAKGDFVRARTVSQQLLHEVEASNTDPTLRWKQFYYLDMQIFDIAKFKRDFVEAEKILLEVQRKYQNKMDKATAVHFYGNAVAIYADREFEKAWNSLLNLEKAQRELPVDPGAPPVDWHVGFANDLTGVAIARSAGKLEEAEARLNRVQVKYKGVWDRTAECAYYWNLADVLLYEGKFEEARAASAKLELALSTSTAANANRSAEWRQPFIYAMQGAEVARLSGRLAEADRRLKNIEHKYNKQWDPRARLYYQRAALLLELKKGNIEKTRQMYKDLARLHASVAPKGFYARFMFDLTAVEIERAAGNFAEAELLMRDIERKYRTEWDGANKGIYCKLLRELKSERAR